MSELSLLLTVAEIGQVRDVEISATEEQRAAIAKRLDLVELKSFTAQARLTAIAGGIKMVGQVKGHVVQSCAATHLPVPARIAEPFDLRFMRDADLRGTAEEEEIEISSDDCEVLPLESERVDVGEAAIQSLSLALDPFPRHPDADRVLAEKGVLSEEQAGPFAALAALKTKKS